MLLYFEVLDLDVHQNVYLELKHLFYHLYLDPVSHIHVITMIQVNPLQNNHVVVQAMMTTVEIISLKSNKLYGPTLKIIFPLIH